MEIPDHRLKIIRLVNCGVSAATASRGISIDSIEDAHVLSIPGSRAEHVKRTPVISTYPCLCRVDGTKCSAG